MGHVSHSDRAVQRRLLKALKATGKPLIVVLLCGNAVARILAGDVSPSGRLPVTFYRSDSDLPDFSDYALAGRTYRYIKCLPLYPFGYGLSYSSFAYLEPRAQAAVIAAGEGTVVTAAVVNTGERDAREVVQVYISARSPQMPAPHWSLCGYDNILIPKGEKREVSFTLPPAAFSLVCEDGSRVVMPGKYTVYLGGAQPDSRSRALCGCEPQRIEITVEGRAIVDL